MNILFIEDDSKFSPSILGLISERFEAVVQEISSIQTGIELLENPIEVIDLVICDYHGQSTTLLKGLLSLCHNLPCILIANETFSTNDVYKINSQFSYESVNRDDLVLNLSSRLDLVLKNEYFKDLKTSDLDFIRAPSKNLFLSGPIKSDIYLRYEENRYSKLYRKGSQFAAADLEQILKEKNFDTFYVRKEQINEILDTHSRGLDNINQQAEIDTSKARQATESTLEVIQDVAQKMGFTPEVQDLAKKSVQLTLKIIGSKPKLTSILEQLRKDEGNYVTSHSLMLAELSCAIACRVGWRSAPTFLKLTIAAFLHDLSIKESRVAKYQTLDEAQQDPEMTPETLLSFKLHPIKAAEYSREFNEIPPDVDTILSQHHEQPDGTGFPRKAFHNQLSPLSCLFIVAQEMLNFFLKTGNDSNVDQFVTEYTEKYKSGVFRKIIKTLLNETD